MHPTHLVAQFQGLQQHIRTTNAPALVAQEHGLNGQATVRLSHSQRVHQGPQVERLAAKVDLQRPCGHQIVHLFSYLVAPHLQKDQLDLLRDDVRFRDRYGDEQLERIIESRENPPQIQIYAGYVMAALGLVVGLLLSSLVMLVLGRLVST